MMMIMLVAMMMTMVRSTVRRMKSDKETGWYDDVKMKRSLRLNIRMSKGKESGARSRQRKQRQQFQVQATNLDFKK